MHEHENNTHENDTSSWPWAFRLYVQFAQAKSHADHYENHEYSTDALNVVMDYIADHIDEPAIQGLASALGEWDEERRR